MARGPLIAVVAVAVAVVAARLFGNRGGRLAEGEVAAGINAGHEDALVDADAQHLEDAVVERLLLRVDKRASALLIRVQPAAAVIGLLLAGQVELALGDAVGRGVESLLLGNLIVLHAGHHTRVGRRRRQSTLGNLGRREEGENRLLVTQHDVAPAGAAVQSIIELRRIAGRPNPVLGADDARAHAIVVADIAVNRDSHLGWLFVVCCGVLQVLFAR